MSESGESCESELSAEAVTLVQNRKSQFVKLNVGGFLFQTTIATLTKVDCMFRGMFSGGFEVQKDPEGWILIDRNGKHFQKILDFLEKPPKTLSLNDKEIEELMTESIYYSMEKLTVQCESELKIRAENKKCALITSTKESTSFIIQNSFKPVVKLYISQTTLLDKFNVIHDVFTQVANLHRNVDLFDKLCSTSNGRIVCIKNVDRNETHCDWTFYQPHGKLVDFIDCVTVTPQIKVSFPEGQIYEKVLKLVANRK
ncbi:BTB/POZ domain-containing adapter for CUL3-mediated RhoA degradation protein 3-like isoform X1 [Panonychus citri]|uniref:BTB/POZ domain-containing adapter for CUL3-mediated RhoA degradation protein 3-like isoform X1 n=1 Tax=Panonychus citri TaxID=50023 RepID=UPI002307CB2C|nr:BTB/POZ domain-containing adapter for CUL3-mediated RhoA degradation protein 3-like isoform X1 [Panonychus citri]